MRAHGALEPSVWRHAKARVNAGRSTRDHRGAARDVDSRSNLESSVADGDLATLSDRIRKRAARRRGEHRCL
jgi:hypothetical protein